MIYSIVFPVSIISIVLLVLGGAQGKPWALYALKTLWAALLAVAAYFASEAWKGSAYSENWAMIGVIFIVWPITVFVFLFAVIERIMLKGKNDRNARIHKLLSVVIVLLLLFIAVSPLLTDLLLK